APRESNIDNPRALKGQKHKNIWNVKKCKYLIINAFALSGRMYESYYSRGAATLCPGLCARCPVGAHPSKARSFKAPHPMSGRLCSLILLIDLLIYHYITPFGNFNVFLQPNNTYYGNKADSNNKADDYGNIGTL
ncbi:hypothetical protein, partial [Xylanibacter rodentium]